MKTSWGWLFLCSAVRFIEASPLIKAGNISSTPVRVSWSTESSCEDFAALEPTRSDPAVVLQVLSERYLHIELNFVYHMEQHSSLTRDNLYLICLDEASVKGIESALGIRCVLLQRDRWPRGDIWELRVRAARCLLLAGYNVVVSDADAVWLNDPFKDMDRLGIGSSNIVAQRDLMPRDISEYWGVTLCFGFAFFRAGGMIPVIFDSITAISSKNHDDQKALNLALFALGIKWDEVGGMHDMRCQDSTGVGRGVIMDGDDPFVVSLLPHSTYPRWCNRSPVSLTTTVVAHCLRHQKGEEISKWMKNVGAWHAP